MDKRIEPNTRYVRWYACGCVETEDDDSIQWETAAGADPMCGDQDGPPHGKLIKEVFQKARPVPITNIAWIFDKPE